MLCKSHNHRHLPALIPFYLRSAQHIIFFHSPLFAVMASSMLCKSQHEQKLILNNLSAPFFLTEVRLQYSNKTAIFVKHEAETTLICFHNRQPVFIANTGTNICYLLVRLMGPTLVVCQSNPLVFVMHVINILYGVHKFERLYLVCFKFVYIPTT